MENTKRKLLYSIIEYPDIMGLGSFNWNCLLITRQWLICKCWNTAGNLEVQYLHLISHSHIKLNEKKKRYYDENSNYKACKKTCTLRRNQEENIAPKSSQLLFVFFLQCNISRNPSLPYTKFQSKKNLTSIISHLSMPFPPTSSFHPTL